MVSEGKKFTEITDFMKKCNSKDDNMIDNDLQKVHNLHIIPGDSIVTADKGFVIIDNSSMGGTHLDLFIY